MDGERIVFSAAETYLSTAIRELRSAYPSARVEQIGPDAGSLLAANLGISELAVECLRRPIVFGRHLMRERGRIAAEEAAEDVDLIWESALDALRAEAVGAELSLHVWTSGASPVLRPDELRRRIAARLTERDLRIVRGGAEWILSVLLTPDDVVLGLNRREDALADWPGGRVGLAHRPDQVSRAELKLDELFQLFSIDLPPTGVALDLGASPGGWTRVLRRRGLAVWAVDPAELDPRAAADPGVTHVRTTAGRFLAETRTTFDVLANDMRMDAFRSSEVMLAAAGRLRRGGLVIATLKIAPRDALTTVQSCFVTLNRSYELLHARQLFHNRNEITVVLRRR